MNNDNGVINLVFCDSVLLLSCLWSMYKDGVFILECHVWNTYRMFLKTRTFLKLLAFVMERIKLDWKLYNMAWLLVMGRSCWFGHWYCSVDVATDSPTECAGISSLVLLDIRAEDGMNLAYAKVVWIAEGPWQNFFPHKTEFYLSSN
jgi:hypothetical protein